MLVRGHRWLHRIGLLKTSQFELPIISIGNLSLGGTGKSPHTAYFQELLTPTFQVGMVSRGYHRKTKGAQEVLINSTAMEAGDEPLQFKLNYSTTPVFVAEKRAEGVRALLQKYPNTNCILLDDAMQHWAIKPYIQVLLTTFDKPFFEDWVVPVGRLREFRSGYKRADIIIVTKCPKDINQIQKEHFIKQIAPLAHQQVYFSFFCYNNLYNLWDRTNTYNIANLKNNAVLVVNGLADSSSLKEYINNNVNNVNFLDFPDHYYYKNEDLELIQQKVKDGIVIITEKDAAKFIPLKLSIIKLGLTIYVLPIKVEIAFGEGINLVESIKSF